MRRTRRLPLEALAPYLWEAPRAAPGQVPAPSASIDWQALFGNDRPVEIEVGFGKGLFLLTAALQHPDVNFFGIEIMRKYQLFTATRMAVRNLSNVRLACADARAVLRDLVPPQSVQTIHVYFPDPWWKKRHHKRRVFTEDFVASCVKALRPGGLLSLATDVAEYFTVMKELCEQQPELTSSPLVEAAPGSETADYLTNFERKAREQGTPINRAAYRKRQAADR